MKLDSKTTIRTPLEGRPFLDGARVALFAILFNATAMASAQGHDLKPAEALKGVSFMEGDWKGKVEFNTGGTPLVGNVTTHIHNAVSGHFVEESISTSLSGRKPSETKHMLSYDPKSGKFMAWWFNDTSVRPLEFEGEVSGNKLVLKTKPAPGGDATGPVFRATYEQASEGKLNYKLEMQQGADWRELFHTSYVKDQPEPGSF